MRIEFFTLFTHAAAVWLQDEMDPAYALLFEHVSSADPSIRLHAVMGLALAYAGTQKEEVCISLFCLVGLFESVACIGRTFEVKKGSSEVDWEGCVGLLENRRFYKTSSAITCHLRMHTAPLGLPQPYSFFKNTVDSEITLNQLDFTVRGCESSVIAKRFRQGMNEPARLQVQQIRLRLSKLCLKAYYETIVRKVLTTLSAGGQVRDLLSPLVGDPEVSMEIGGAAALALGLVFISSQDEECVGAALQVRNSPLFE